MSRSRRSPYHSDLGWILGFAFEDTLTRPARLAQEFTFVRCHGSPRASSPHGLTAPAMPPLDAIRCVQLPPARGCYQPAPQRTLTSNPVPMPGTPPPPAAVPLPRCAGEDPSLRQCLKACCGDRASGLPPPPPAAVPLPRCAGEEPSL